VINEEVFNKEKYIPTQEELAGNSWSHCYGSSSIVIAITDIPDPSKGRVLKAAIGGVQQAGDKAASAGIDPALCVGPINQAR